MRPVFEALRTSGKYTRFVEPCAGAFVMPLIAREAGWQPTQMESSDVSLFSSVCGLYLGGKDLGVLDVRVDGQPLELDGPTDVQAALILYTQLLLRMETRPEVDYWKELIRDLYDRRKDHIEAIRDDLAKLQKRLGGIEYEPLDLWAHLDRHADNPEV
jgi:hypothetical protein